MVLTWIKQAVFFSSLLCAGSTVHASYSSPYDNFYETKETKSRKHLLSPRFNTQPHAKRSRLSPEHLPQQSIIPVRAPLLRERPNKDRGGYLWNLFLSQYKKESGITPPPLPLAFFEDRYNISIDEETDEAMIIDPQTHNTVSRFLIVPALNPAHSHQIAPYYEALMTAAFLGCQKALTAQHNLRLLSKKFCRPYFSSQLMRLGLDSQGNGMQDFIAWTYFVKKMLIETYTYDSPEGQEEAYQRFYQMLQGCNPRMWLKQLDQSFGPVSVPLTYSQAFLVMSTTLELGESLNGFLTDLITWHTGNTRLFAPQSLDALSADKTFLHTIGEILMYTKISVDRFMHLILLRQTRGEMIIKDLQPEPQTQETVHSILYEIRYEMYSAFNAPFLSHKKYLLSLETCPQALKNYDTYLRDLLADLKELSTACEMAREGTSFLRPSCALEQTQKIPKVFSWD